MRALIESALLLPLGPAQPEPEPPPQGAAAQVPRVVLDCDPGGDDVVALLWLLSMQHQGACELLAVTTTEGNVKAPLTFAAADKVLTLMSAVLSEAEIPVCAQTPASGRRGSADERRLARSRYAQEVAAVRHPPAACARAEFSLLCDACDSSRQLSNCARGRGWPRAMATALLRSLSTTRPTSTARMGWAAWRASWRGGATTSARPRATRV